MYASWFCDQKSILDPAKHVTNESQTLCATMKTNKEIIKTQFKHAK